jgi:hypothetical protein
LTSTTQATHWISETYRMIHEEQEKFEDRIEEPKNLKLIVDFESTELDTPKNQMEIPDIKYKQIRKLSKKEVDLKNKQKPSNNLF